MKCFVVAVILFYKFLNDVNKVVLAQCHFALSEVGVVLEIVASDVGKQSLVYLAVVLHAFVYQFAVELCRLQLPLPVLRLVLVQQVLRLGEQVDAVVKVLYVPEQGAYALFLHFAKLAQIFFSCCHIHLSIMRKCAKKINCAIFCP